MLIPNAGFLCAFIADPAVRDHQELQDGIEHIKNLSF